jgi:DNA-binding response OmpR family regulator
MTKVLLVEDDLPLGETLRDLLIQEGFEVAWETTLQGAKKITGAELVLLDLALPDGLAWSWFETDKVLPRTMILTAHGEPEDRIRGLELGAVDYLVKPFYFKELLLRIRNQLVSEEAPQKIGLAEVDFKRYELRSQGIPHSLTHKEAEILKYLLRSKGKVVSRDELLDAVWGASLFPTPRTIDNFISRLRKWIEYEPETPRYIRSVRGIGYQLICEPDS